MNEDNREDAGKNIVLMTQYVQQNYPNVTIQEMELAHQMAIKGEFPLKPKDDFKVFAMITPAQVSAVMIRFQEYKRNQLKPAVNTPEFAALSEPAPLPPPTAEELDVLHLQMLVKAFDTVGQGKVYMDWGSALYDALDAKGLVYFDTAEKYEFLEMAKLEVIGEQEQKVQKMLHTILYKSALNILESMKTNNFDSLNLKSKAKNIALNKLVSELVAMEWTPEEFWVSENKN